MSKYKDDGQVPENTVPIPVPDVPPNDEHKERKGKQDHHTIAELAETSRTSPAIVAAVCEANGWMPGKRLSEKEFTEAVTRFVKAPAGGTYVTRR